MDIPLILFSYRTKDRSVQLSRFVHKHLSNLGTTLPFGTSAGNVERCPSWTARHASRREYCKIRHAKRRKPESLAGRKFSHASLTLNQTAYTLLIPPGNGTVKSFEQSSQNRIFEKAIQSKSR